MKSDDTPSVSHPADCYEEDADGEVNRSSIKYCPEGTQFAEFCPAGNQCEMPNTTEPCQLSHYCPAGTAVEKLCPAGTLPPTSTQAPCPYTLCPATMRTLQDIPCIWQVNTVLLRPSPSFVLLAHSAVLAVIKPKHVSRARTALQVVLPRTLPPAGSSSPSALSDSWPP